MIHSKNQPNELSASGKRRIARLVRELEALSASSNSPAEAANAAAKAQSLLIKNQLTIAELEEFEEQPDALMEHKEVLDGKMRIDSWKRMLLAVVCEACLCEWMTNFASERCERTISFIGRASNVEIARYTFRVLERQVIAIGETEKARRRQGGESVRKYFKDYLEGVVDSIYRQLTKERKTTVAANPDANALVLRQSTEAFDHRKSLYPNVKFSNTTTYYEPNSRERGRIAGENVSFHDAIGSSGKRTRLIE